MASAVLGLAKLKRRLARIPKRMRADVAVAVNTGADDLVAFQRRLVPVEQGDLRGSIHKEAGLHELSVVVMAGGAATTKPVRKGADASYDYALAQEFGTKKMHANPFFFPAYRANRKRIRGRIARAVRKTVEAG